MARKKTENSNSHSQTPTRTERKAEQHKPRSSQSSPTNEALATSSPGTSADLAPNLNRSDRRLQRVNGGNSDAYLQPDDDHFINFQNQLASLGLALRDIPGDGNCLFRALGDQLEGHGRNHFQHRMDTVRFMINNRKDFEPFIDDEMPYERYIDNLARPGTYAGQDALVAFARLHKVSIVIHQLASPLWHIEGGSDGCRELHLSYHNGEHYSSVRLRDDRSETPANICLSSKQQMVASTSSNKGPIGSVNASSSKNFSQSSRVGRICRETSKFPNVSSKLEQQRQKFLSPAAAFLDSATEDDIDSGAELLGLNRSCVVASSGAEESGVGEQLAVEYNAVIQYIMENTGCTDELLIEEVLRANQQNVELAVDHLLGLLYQPQTEESISSEITDSGTLTKSCEDKNGKQELKNGAQGSSRSGAKPKTPQKKLTNRERKAQHQKEKMEKKEERRQKQKAFEEEQRRENECFLISHQKLNYLNL